MENNLAFDHAFKVMGATQQLMVRSLINLIEMISTSSHRYAQDNSAFTDEALSLMQKAASTREPDSLRDLQKEWAQTCMKFSQSQTRATMGFVEQFGQQVLGTIANNPFTPLATPVPATAPSPVKPAAPTPRPQAKTAAEPKPAPKPAPELKAAPKPETPMPVKKASAPKAPAPAPAPKASPVKAAVKTQVAKTVSAKAPAKPKAVAKTAGPKVVKKNSTGAEKS